MSSLEVVDPRPQPVNYLRRWLISLIMAGLLTLIVVAGGIFLAYNHIRSNTSSFALTMPSVAGPPVFNQIAFTGNDNNIWLVSPSGQNLRQLTEDNRRYRFPTWSPDGTRLAFLGRGETNTTVLYVSPTAAADPTVVYQEDTSSPFYLYWAPNGQAITFLTQETTGMSMRLVDIRQPENNRLVERGAPFYWVWSPQSDRLLMHVGGSRAASNSAHLSFLDNHHNAERVELNLSPGRFQAPAWSSTGDSIFYIGDNGDEQAIYKTNVTSFEQQKITNVTGFAFMTIASDDERIAYLQFEPGTRPPFGRAYMVDTSGDNRQLIINELVASIYWSPDGSKLALLSISRANGGSSAEIHKPKGLAAPLAQDILLRWWIYDVQTGTREPLTSFAPTRAFLQTVPYFDQYHLSLTFWSPDSRYFVVTKGQDDIEAGDVWVFDTRQEEEARQVGEGKLAVWSWR